MSEQESPVTSITPEATPDFTPPMTQSEFYASLENFDAITDLPTWQGQDKLANLGPAPAVTLEAFSPDDRKALEARANEINPHNREAAVAQAISERLGREAINLRVRSTADDASHYVREHCALEFEIVEAERESMLIAAQLGEMRTVRDPITGNQVETEEFAITGAKREALSKKLMDLFHRSEAIAGSEGQRRRNEAREKDWAEYVDRQRRVWESQEVDRRAHKMVSDDRINAAAANRARHLKGGA
jgi:hypothetical protein